MLEVTMEEHWCEPPPNLISILDLFAILPPHHFHRVGIWCQKVAVVDSADAALDDEHTDLYKRNNGDELAPANSRADTKADTAEESFISSLTLVNAIIPMVILSFFVQEFFTVNSFKVFELVEPIPVIHKWSCLLIRFH